MDVRRRVLASRLAVRINNDEAYCKEIGLTDHSQFRDNSKGGAQDVFDSHFLIVRSNAVL